MKNNRFLSADFLMTIIIADLLFVCLVIIVGGISVLPLLFSNTSEVVTWPFEFVFPFIAKVLLMPIVIILYFILGLIVYGFDVAIVSLFTMTCWTIVATVIYIPVYMLASKIVSRVFQPKIILMSNQGGNIAPNQYEKRNNHKFFMLIFWWYYLLKGMLVRENQFSNQCIGTTLGDEKAEKYMPENKSEPDTDRGLEDNKTQPLIALLYAITFPISYGIFALVYNYMISSIPEIIAILVVFIVAYSCYQFLPTILFVTYLKLRYKTMTIVTIIMIPVMMLLNLLEMNTWLIIIGNIVATQLGFAIGKITGNLIESSDD